MACPTPPTFPTTTTTTKGTQAFYPACIRQNTHRTHRKDPFRVSARFTDEACVYACGRMVRRGSMYVSMYACMCVCLFVCSCVCENKNKCCKSSARSELNSIKYEKHSDFVKWSLSCFIFVQYVRFRRVGGSFFFSSWIYMYVNFSTYMLQRFPENGGYCSFSCWLDNWYLTGRLYLESDISASWPSRITVCFIWSLRGMNWTLKGLGRQFPPLLVWC